jgi:hypothetical protein
MCKRTAAASRRSHPGAQRIRMSVRMQKMIISTQGPNGKIDSQEEETSESRSAHRGADRQVDVVDDEEAVGKHASAAATA